MDLADRHLLLMLAGGMLAGSALLSVVALQVQKQQKRLANRIMVVSGAYQRDEKPEEVRRTARRQAQRRPILHQIAGLFGYDPGKADLYPVKWWVVLIASMIAARVMAQLMLPLFGYAVMGIVPLAGLVICRFVYKYLDGKRRRKLYVQLPDALGMIVRGVKVGIPVQESLISVGREAPEPTGHEFRLVAERVSLGAPVDEALYELAERNGLPEYRFFATAIGLQMQTGGALSETLDNLAEVIRKRLALRARAYALASEARMSIMILCALPVVAGIVLSVINPEYVHTLFHDPTGQKVLATALISFSIGFGSMQVIVKKSLS